VLAKGSRCDFKGPHVCFPRAAGVLAKDCIFDLPDLQYIPEKKIRQDIQSTAEQTSIKIDKAIIHSWFL
ncbi:unnamed protein product, partial [Candidula unifasciata]